MTGVSGREVRRPLGLLPWLAVGLVMLALAAVAVVRLFVSEPEEPDDASSVRAVADLAAGLTEELDVDGGVALLCDRPIELYRMAVESTITAWQSRSGTQAPAIEATLSDVDAGSAGSFVIRIASEEEGLESLARGFRVFVEDRAGRSCVVGVGGVDAKRPTTRFAAGGYLPATSPSPVPTRTPRPSPGPS